METRKAENSSDKALVLYWRGKSLDCGPDYNPEAESMLSKAVSG